MEEKLLTPLYHPGLTMAEIWQGVGRVFDAVRSLLTLPLKLRPTGLGSGIDKDRLITPSSLASARSAAFTRPAAVPTVCAGQGRKLRVLQPGFVTSGWAYSGSQL